MFRLFDRCITRLAYKVAIIFYFSIKFVALSQTPVLPHCLYFASRHEEDEIIGSNMSTEHNSDVYPELRGPFP